MLAANSDREHRKQCQPPDNKIERDSACNSHGIASGLFKFDKGTVEVLGMQEKHRLAMCADARLAITQNARAGRLQPLAGSKDIIDLVTDVVDSAIRALFEKLRDGRISAQRLQQLYFRVRKLDEDHRHPMLWLRQWRRHRRTEGIAIESCCSGESVPRLPRD